jgi:asparagine synthetase B (glutamine-hydrolysing)
MLGRLEHLSLYETRAVEADGAWLGVCGRPATIAVAEGPDGLSAVACGETLNASRLRQELGLDTGADLAAVALAAYRRWRGDLFAHLDGVFSVVVHDAAERRTVAGTDAYRGAVMHAVGVGQDVLIASEAKAFTCDPRFTPHLDEEAMASLLALEMMIDGRTLFEGVRDPGVGRHFEVSDRGLSRVQHWDPREVTGGTLRGDAYLDHLAATITELGEWLFAGERLLLPLTGGLDSRLLAAAAPPGIDLLALTFGSSLDQDARRAAQISRACGLRHVVAGLEEDYLPRYGDGTVWLTEGRLNPIANFNGGQMDRFADRDAVVSGLYGEVGRSTMRGRFMIPDRELLQAGDREFEQRFIRDVMKPNLAAPWWDALFGDRGRELLQSALDEATRILGETRGLPVPDRIDISMGALRFHAGRSGMLYSDFWIDARPAFLTRRWVAAVLAGAPEERLDDSMRLRLIRRLNKAVAAVPWVCTRLPLGISDVGVRAVRHAARLRLGGGAAVAQEERPTAASNSHSRAVDLVRRTKKYLYRPGERREDWLRGLGRSYAEELLLSQRLTGRGVMDADGVRALFKAQMDGGSHALSLGQLMNFELWQRLFVDGDELGGTAPLIGRSAAGPY